MAKKVIFLYKNRYHPRSKLLLERLLAKSEKIFANHKNM